jgi:predicted DNA-binding protein with PD1-like motif
MMEWNGQADAERLESVSIFGVEVKTGTRVRLWPQKTADIMDMALKGKVEIVEAIERDFDDRVHLAVVLEDDPGRDLGMLRQPGHRFFFSPDEVEPLALNGEVSHER